mgnify:CR=1 FL=1
MGVDIHIGPFIIVNEYPSTSTTTEFWGCPKCRKHRDGTFCSKCGGPNENCTKVKTTDMDFYSFMEEYAPDAEEVLWAPESMRGMLLPNYIAPSAGTSSYEMKNSKKHNKLDITADVIDTMLVDFGSRTAGFVAALEKQGVDYKIGFGAVTYYS